MSSRLKYGVYSGNTDSQGKVVKGKSLSIYGEGMVDKEKIENEIIPIIEEKKIDFPVVICSHYSRDLPSKTGIDIIDTKTGSRFKPRRKSGIESCNWLIDKNKHITKT